MARFELRIDDELAGRASHHVTDDAMALPHTEIAPSRHGRGLGTILVRGVLAAARQRRLRVLPYCPFVRHVLLIHPAELDLAAAADRTTFGLSPVPLRRIDS